MAATVQHQHHSSTPSNAGVVADGTNQTPQLKRIVYSKYRELLGSYNDKSNAIINTLPAYRVHEDRGFNLGQVAVASCPQSLDSTESKAASKPSPTGEVYGQRGGGGGGYEAPACVQNAMMTKDKKPFTYTPGGIDLSQIKSERMAKRLARNAQAEGATGASQQNRPAQPLSPSGGGSGSPAGATAAMGAAALGMPFQVLPPPPPPPQPGTLAAAGKKPSNGNPVAPPPPPQSTLAPPNNGRTSAPNSPSMARKSPTPQRFEPPPLGFRPEIKIPPNPMAALRKVPPPVEKNTFWKDEYVKERSKSPMPENPVADSSTSSYSEPYQQNQFGGNGYGNGSGGNDIGNDFVDAAPRKTSTPQQQLPETYNNNNYTPYNHQQQQKYAEALAPAAATTPQPQLQSVPPSPLCSEFRSVPAPQSPAVSVYTRQTDSPLQQRSTDSPFRYVPQQQQQQHQQQPSEQQQHQQQRSPIATSPLAQQSTKSAAAAAATASQPQAQTVPWRTQRSQSSATTQSQQQQQQQQPQPIYNNVQPQQRSRDVFSPGPAESATATAAPPQLPQSYSTQQAQYQGPKPTNVGTLYIAPLAPTTSEPQAPYVVRQQLQQQQPQARDSPMRQLPPLQQQQPLGWLRSQPVAKEQAPWARAEENGNVLPSSLRGAAPPQQQQPPYQVDQPYQGNGFASPQQKQQHYQQQQQQQPSQNFGSQGANAVSGLRLQINVAPTAQNSTVSQSGPRERIIPITLEQTPTYAAAQPNFGAPAGHIIRSANQFVDQGYNNYPASHQQQQPQQQQQQQQQQQRLLRQSSQPPQQQVWREPSVQRTATPTQKPQQPNMGGTRIIPIAVEGGRGPISSSPIVLQNDPRSPPVQSKSFRILQKITDTVDDGSPDGSGKNNFNNADDGSEQDAPAQLHRPQFARQMSAQQARSTPNVEQIRRLQLQNSSNNNNNHNINNTSNHVQEQTQSIATWQQQQQDNASAQPHRFNQQRPSYDISQQYVPPSEQQVPEPKKYTGSAIPSRSFKILQAMTTPENADHKINAELDSAMENFEMNERNNKSSNQNNASQIKNKSDNTNISQNEHITDHSSATPTPPPTTSTSISSSKTFSSNSSLSSESSCPSIPRSQSVPPQYPYVYPYAYPWYPLPLPPLSNQGEAPQLPPWYPPAPHNGEAPPLPPWCPPPPINSQVSQLPPWNLQPKYNETGRPYSYPYSYFLNASQNEQNLDGTNGSAYPPYPYFYPYYPAYGQPATVPTGGESNGIPLSSFPSFVPPYPYPYPMAPSYSQSSSSSRASSALPDIIITPSTDDMPSKVILQHHIKVEKREPSKRAHSVEIEDVSTKSKAHNNAVVRGEIIDVLSQRLATVNKIGGGLSQGNLSQDIKKSYAGEQSKPCGSHSSSENASPVQITATMTESEIDDSSDSDSSEDESEATPKYGENYVPLQSIRSVTNVQVYKGLGQQLLEQVDSDDDDEHDVTTADGESDVFDEEEEEIVEELELDECIEDNDNDDNYIDEDNLSVIYEEESDMERSSDYAKTVIKRDGSSVSDATIDNKNSNDDEMSNYIEYNNKDEEEDEESNSVTVRLPLKFSFSRDDKVATVEVGNSQIEERGNNYQLENKVKSFSVAHIESDSEKGDGDDDCEVSVTISLTPSSRSSSVEKKDQYKTSTAYPVEELQVPEDVHRNDQNDDETVSFSLNMRNKFLSETVNGDVTNNIVEQLKSENTSIQPVQVISAPIEEIDFFATLRATKLQAQKMMEQSKTYWGKSTDKTDTQSSAENTDKNSEEPKEPVKAAEHIRQASQAKVQTSLEAARNSFWSTFDATNTEVSQPVISPNGDSVEKNSHWTQKKKTAIHTQMVRENIGRVEYWTTTLSSRVDAMPEPKRAEISFIVEESYEPKEEPDFWASIEKSLESNKDVRIDSVPDDFWMSPEEANNTNEHEKEISLASCSIAEEQKVSFYDEKENLQNDGLVAESTEEDPGSWRASRFNESDNFNPALYPEEPREVDTDEEIDFWAEIEAKRINDDDEVTFHKSASFWAQQDRQNSIDETPFKPVERKAFHAKLPDEPTMDINIWAALEAVRGEDPVFVDPEKEEEQALAQVFNQMSNDDDMEVKNCNKGVEEEIKCEEIVTNELLDGSTWSQNNCDLPKLEAPPEHYEEPETDFWADIEHEREEKMDCEEAEQKRNNYRKAMAFFSTSIDEHKDQTGAEKYKDSSNINTRSSVITEEEEPICNDWQPTNAIHIGIGPPDSFETTSKQDESTKITKTMADGDSSSDCNSTPTNFESKIPEIYVEPKIELKRLANGLPDLEVNKFNEERKISVRQRISTFETVANEPSKPKSLATQSLSVESYTPNSSLSRNSSTQRSESEMEEDDSGVTDMNKQLSETDTESESFPELRKMTSYQRAATHSRLFKLLQDENDLPEGGELLPTADEFQFKPSRRKIVHNVSITRKQNPKLLAEAETMTQRRERLSLPLRKNTSIDADNPSTPNSPASPIMGQPSSLNGSVSDKLVNELVQSLLLKSDSTHLRNLPMARLQAAAKRALKEEMDSLENTSVDSTPAPTPKQDKAYADYYNTWSDASGSENVVPSNSFRALQDNPRRSPWTVRCPRVLSSKTVNRDLARVTESPEIAARNSKSPECFCSSRERSVSNWRKV